jgi:hypothetical protein
MTYPYAGIAYANPDAVTKITSGASGTTYAYDLNGNLTSAGNGVSTTTYSYDYNNRLIALLLNGATSTTYGYDAFGTASIKSARRHRPPLTPIGFTLLLRRQSAPRTLRLPPSTCSTGIPFGNCAGVQKWSCDRDAADAIRASRSPQQHRRRVRSVNRSNFRMWLVLSLFPHSSPSMQG